jgi:predicted proteasome-type protease
MECPPEILAAVQGQLGNHLRLSTDGQAHAAMKRLWMTRLAQVLEQLMQGRIPAQWETEKLAA